MLWRADFSSPITRRQLAAIKALSPITMRSVAIRFKRLPNWECYATGVRLVGVRRSPVADKLDKDQMQGALVNVGRAVCDFYRDGRVTQIRMNAIECDYAANLPKSHHAKYTVYTSF